MISSGFPIATRRHVEAGEHCTLTTQCPENAKVVQSPGLPCDSVCHQSQHEEMWHLTSARATVKQSYLWRGFMFTVQSQASSVLWTFKDGWNTSAEPIVWSPIRKAYLFLNTVHFLNRVSASRWKKIWNSPDQIYSLPQLSISALHISFTPFQLCEPESTLKREALCVKASLESQASELIILTYKDSSLQQCSPSLCGRLKIRISRRVWRRVLSDLPTSQIHCGQL